MEGWLFGWGLEMKGFVELTDEVTDLLERNLKGIGDEFMEKEGAEERREEKRDGVDEEEDDRVDRKIGVGREDDRAGRKEEGDGVDFGGRSEW